MENILASYIPSFNILEIVSLINKFLDAIDQNTSFTFNLPELYVRGFLDGYHNDIKIFLKNRIPSSLEIEIITSYIINISKYQKDLISKH